MAREITSGFQTEIESQVLRIGLLVKAEFDDGDVNVFTGYGMLDWNGDTYIGSKLLSVSQIEESQQLDAKNIAFDMNGFDSALISLALTENYSGRPISAWFAVQNVSTGAIIADPYKVFSGYMDVIEAADYGEKADYRINCESDLIDLRDPKETRYTPEDQKLRYAGDLGLDYVPLIQDVELTWGVNVAA